MFKPGSRGRCFFEGEPTSQIQQNQTVGLYYIYNAPDYDIKWREKMEPGLKLALQRLALHFQNEWWYTFAGEYETGYPIGGKALSDIIMARQIVVDSGFDYTGCSVPVFVFANTREAFLIKGEPVIYMSDNTFQLESQGVQTLIEHEVCHRFGLPDHMEPWTKPEYGNCIMGNVYLGRIQFCSECRAKLGV